MLRGSSLRGRRFGALVHGILAVVDLNATPEEIGAVARVQGRMVGATETRDRGRGAHSHRCARTPHYAQGCIRRRQQRTPRDADLLRREDGTLLEGVVDLAFREEGPDFAGWTVVDFKTDREFELGRTGAY